MQLQSHCFHQCRFNFQPSTGHLHRTYQVLLTKQRAFETEQSDAAHDAQSK